VGQPPLPASPRAADTGFANSADPAGHAGGRPAEDSDDLDTAIELWRRRRDSAGAAVEVLRQELTDLHWHGSAAAQFTSWTHAHLDRCTALADHAHTAHAALTRTDPAAPRTMDHPPEPMAPQAFPTDPATGPARPGGSPIPVARADPPSTASPASPPVVTATPPSGSIGAPPGSTRVPQLTYGLDTENCI